METAEEIKKRYLSLPYSKKIFTLNKLAEKDFTAYMIVSNYYRYADVENGGLPSNLIDKELELSFKKKYFINKKQNKNIIL